MNSLIDSFGRAHRDLRVSLTDKCNLRCTYCLPEDFVHWIPSKDLLTIEEMLLVIEQGTNEGITEVRLTGGEPLIHPGIVELVAGISALKNAPQLSLTTNGVHLARLAKPLVDAGLERLNVSLDTLNPQTFKKITKRDNFANVVQGIKQASLASIKPIKINTVLIRGVNDFEARDLLRWAIESNLNLRFIEQMPLDAGGNWSRELMITAEEILNELSKEFTLTPKSNRGSSPAEEFEILGTNLTVGIIASVTRPFCGNCDRLRLTSDGQLRSCLFANEELELKHILRNEDLTLEQKQMEISSVYKKCVSTKKAGHGIDSPEFIAPLRPMSAIGG